MVGVDFGDGGREAIALARTLCARPGRVTLTHVVTSDPSFFRGVSEEFVAAERARVLALLARRRDLAYAENDRGWRSSVQVDVRCEFWDSAGRGLHEAAEATQADLIVVGSSRQGLLGRVLLGDDTRAALDGAPCAVAIAPAGYAGEPTPLGMIGVGYDGSPESTVAVEAARALAGEQDAALSAMTVVSVPTSRFGPGPLPLHDAIETLRHRARDEIEALGGMEPHVAYGATAEELAVFSGRCDLLVLGSRGYGAWGRLVHGSTSRQLSRTARCPLLVLARAAQRAGDVSDVLSEPDRARADREAAHAPGAASAR